MYIYRQPATAYEFTVQTEDIRRGTVGGTNTAEEQVSNSGLYLTKTNATSSDNNKKNRYPITATPSSNRLVFSHWTLNGSEVPNLGASIPAGGITIPNDGAVLEAHFKQNESYEPTDEEKLGRSAMDKQAFQEWLTERLADRTTLVEDGCDKTAEVYDYENRIYRVDLTTQSKLPIFDGEIDLAFLIDVSASMKFPSSLYDSSDVSGEDAKNISKINDYGNNNKQNWQNWGLDTSKTYYVITDPESTSTVCELVYKKKNNTTQWWLRDASKTGDGNLFDPADPGNKAYYNTTDKCTYVIKEAGDPVTGEETGSLAEAIQNAGLNVGQPKTRRVYLEASIKDAIKEMYSIKQQLAYAKNSDNDYQPKIAYNMFCGYINKYEHNFVSAPQDGDIGQTYSYEGGTSTDIALLDAAGWVRADVNGNEYTGTNSSNWYREDSQSPSYSKGTGDHAGFQWNPDSTKRYALLITDGAPQRSSLDIDRQYLFDAKEYLDQSDVTLVSVGLSMKDVKKGSELLYNISDVDDLYVPYYYRADTGDQLSNVIYETLSTTLTDAIVVGNVSDTINEAFYPVDRATGNPLANGDWVDLDGNLVDKRTYQGKHGVVSYSSATDSYSVNWSDQSIKSTGWHGSIYVKAKEDLLGGNAVLTNDGNAQIDVYGYKNKEEATTIELQDSLKKSVQLDSPKVNVNELLITNNSSEWTVYVGEQVDPLAQLKALYDNIDVVQVINAGTDTDHDGFIDKVNKDNNTSHAYNNNMFYPLPEDVDGMRSDGREDAGSGTRKTFKLKDLIKKLQNGAELDWDTLLAEANKTGTEDDPVEQQNRGITIPYNAYGIPGNSTITIKLTKDIKPNEPDISNTAHEAMVVGDDVETYTLTVIYEPDYNVLPTGQGGEADIATYHLGQFESKYQGTAAGRETRDNTHVINVYAEPLDVLKVDDEGDVLPGATFGLYRVAQPDESTVDLSTFDSSLTGSYHCVSTAASGDDGIAHLAPVEDGNTKWDVIAKGQTYYLIETSAPSGYKRDSAKKVVTVETTNGLYTNLAGTTINAKTYPFNWDEGVIIKVGGSPATIVDAQGHQATNGSGQNLTYVLKSDPVTFQTTIVNEKVVVTDINVLKVDDDGEELADAVFQLKVVRDGSDVLVLNDTACSEVGGVGDVTVAVNGESRTYASAFKSTNAAQTITGLPDGDYRLVEVLAPAGHIITVPEIEFTITEGVVTSATAESSEDVSLEPASGNTLALLTITNAKGQPLPNAGGSGTTLFYAVGGLLMAGAAVAVARDRRRSCEA